MKNSYIIVGFFIIIACVLGYLYRGSFEKTPPAVAIPNPASAHCTNAGGSLEIKTNTDGSQYGVCTFANGHSCEEWAFMRGECSKDGNAQTEDTASTTLSDVNNFYDIKISYPTEPKDTAGVMKQYAEYVFAQKKEEWKMGGEAYVAEQELTKKFPDRAMDAYTYLSQYERSTSEKLGTVTYLFTNYEMTGGANGNTTVTSFTFNTQGQVKIEDILHFENGNDITLTKLLATKIMADENLKGYTDAAVVDDGLGLKCLTKKNTFDRTVCKADGFFFPSNFQNFIVTDTGLTFVMNKFQVAAGVANTPHISFTWAELAPFMNQTFSLPLD